MTMHGILCNVPQQNIEFSLRNLRQKNLLCSL